MTFGNRVQIELIDLIFYTPVNFPLTEGTVMQEILVKVLRHGNEKSTF